MTLPRSLRCGSVVIAVRRWTKHGATPHQGDRLHLPNQPARVAKMTTASPSSIRVLQWQEYQSDGGAQLGCRVPAAKLLDFEPRLPRAVGELVKP
jgi:hypothetical protein